MWPDNLSQWSEEWLQRYVTTCALRDGYLFHADGLGSNKGSAAGNKMKLTGARKGWPDMVFILDSRVVFIELKTEAGRLSREQLLVHDKMRELGCEVYTVYASNGEDAWGGVKAILNGIGVKVSFDACR